MNLRTHLHKVAVELDSATARKNFGRRFTANGRRRESAVLVLFHLDEDGFDGDIIMIRRALNPRDPHSGQLSFPGGMLETVDEEDPIKTALRETYEEIGIPYEKVNIICSMECFTVNTGVSIIPVLGILKGEYLETWRKDLEEVAEVLRIRWSLLEKSRIQHVRYGRNGWKNTQAYKSSAGLIWGASARILSSLS